MAHRFPQLRLSAPPNRGYGCSSPVAISALKEGSALNAAPPLVARPGCVSPPGSGPGERPLAEPDRCPRVTDRGRFGEGAYHRRSVLPVIGCPPAGLEPRRAIPRWHSQSSACVGSGWRAPRSRSRRPVRSTLGCAFPHRGGDPTTRLSASSIQTPRTPCNPRSADPSGGDANRAMPRTCRSARRSTGVPPTVPFINPQFPYASVCPNPTRRADRGSSTLVPPDWPRSSARSQVPRSAPATAGRSRPGASLLALSPLP